MRFRALTPVVLPLFLGICCVPASARGVDEARGTIRMEGWVSVVCHVSPPAQRQEMAASGAERVVLTFTNTCNQGSYKVWLESAVGVREMAAGDGSSLSLAAFDQPLIEQSALSHGHKRSLVVNLDRSAGRRAMTLRIRPDL